MNQILIGDCRDSMDQLLREGVRVQMTVTSPPYFQLRNYNVPESAWPAVVYRPMVGLPPVTVPAMTCCLGNEPTPQAYIGHLVEVFRRVYGLLHNDGVLWLNIGDSYARAAAKGQHKPGDSGKQAYVYNEGHGRASASMDLAALGLPPKNLLGIPWMLAFALQADGWILRSDCIWHKPNAQPESCTDRPARGHEYLLLLVKSARYFFDHEAIKEPAKWARWGDQRVKKEQQGAARWIGGRPKAELQAIGKRNKRTVWSIPTRGYSGAHFAVFPPLLVEPCVLAGTSAAGHCPQCGARWLRVTEKATAFQSGAGRAGRSAETVNQSGKWAGRQHGQNLKLGPVVASRTLGWRPGCRCGVAPVPDIVFDPFMGAGTTAVVAATLGRQWLGCDLNASYLPMPKYTPSRPPGAA